MYLIILTMEKNSTKTKFGSHGNTEKNYKNPHGAQLVLNTLTNKSIENGYKF